MSASTPWPEPQFVCSLCRKPSGPSVPDHFCWGQFWQVAFLVVAFIPVAVMLVLLVLSLLSPTQTHLSSPHS